MLHEPKTKQMYQIIEVIGMPKRLYHKIWLIMRLTTVILIACLMQVSAAGLAQKITLNQRDVPLSNVLKEIRKQSGFDVFSEGKGLPKNQKVTVVVTNASIEEALDQAFKGLGYTYKIDGKTIAIKPKDEVSFFERIINRFQTIDVSGKIVDENGQPIAGATIKVKGTTISTASDGNGVFLLKNISDDALVQISYLCYQVKEVRASKDIGSIKMELAVGKLEEVTVNAGYYSVKEKELTGSISRITSKDIENQPVTNVLATMQGRMAGVNIIQTTGTPGGGFDIKIRGQNSLRPEANQPFYIIDGVPFSSTPIGYNQTSTTYPNPTSPLNSINPDNIESIEVLKDADATAIYGSRGANGVVLITTKSGKAGKTSFSLNASTGGAKVAKFMELMNTEQYLTMRRKAFSNDKINTYPANAYDINGTWDQSRYTDWQKELIGGTAHLNDIYGTVSGGSEKTQFLLSGSYRTESTVYVGDFLYKKGGAQFNLNHRSDDSKFRLNISVGYNNQDNDLPALDFSEDARLLAPNAPALYSSDGSLNWENKTWQNPLRNLTAKYKANTNNLLTNTVLSYELFSGLVVKTSLGYTSLGTTETRTSPSTIFNPANNISSSRSSIYVNNTQGSSWVAEPQISWSKELGTVGKLDALFGATFQNQTSNLLYQTANNFSSNSLIYNLGAATNISVLLNEENVYRYQAFFGRLNYNLKQRYIVNFTARRDGSSRFGPGNRFSNFGAVGAAWLFSNENFLENNSWISLGKLRASYGITGNDQIGDYQFLDTYNTSGISYDGVIGLDPSRLYNANFAWETNKKLEIGLELGFLNDRIFATTSWYQNRSSNQLTGIPLPGTTGFTVLQANLDATVENKGMEFTLRTINLSSKNFSWTTNFNLTFSRNTLLKFPGLASSSYSQQYRIGQPLNIKLLYAYKGINPQTGVYTFEDLNNDGRISFPEDRQIVADLNPKYFGGIQNQLSFKNWKLDFLLQFVNQKNSSYLPRTPGLLSNQPSKIINSWQQQGDNATYQLYTTGTNSLASTANGLYANSSAYFEDASYIRLKNVAISYALPIKLEKTQLRINLQGQNLFTLTNYKDGDPEFITSGYLSPLKVFTAGLQASF